MKKKGKFAIIDDKPKTVEEIREEYKRLTGEYPKPLTEEEKREYGLID